MTNLLIKLFIGKNSGTIDNKTREKYGVMGSIVGILSNFILFVVKLLVGIFINSIAILADSFNNLADSASSLITLFGFKLANRPADDEHPFGHGRIEYLSALLVSCAIILVGLEFLKSSFMKILKPEPVIFNVTAVVLLFITIVVKLWQSKFNRTIGEKIDSQALIATAQDSLNDVLITTSTVISIFIMRFTNLNVDGYFGVLVAFFLVYAGYSLAKETLSPLLGESVKKETAEEIKQNMLKHDGILGVHDLLVHNYGPNKSMASIHAEVDYKVNIYKSHELIDKIEREIYESMGVLLTIHMDPIDIDDERLICINKKVNNILKAYNESINAHDFRIVDGDENINVIFDLAFPHSVLSADKEKMILEIKKEIKDIDKRYTCILNIEKLYEEI